MLKELSENENYQGNIEDSRKRKTAVSRKESLDSVIYLGTIQSTDQAPLVDLTQSSDSLPTQDLSMYSKPIKTIYFSRKNFERKLLRKNTTSLVNLPVVKRTQVPRRLFSASILNKKKLSILNLPAKFLHPSDFYLGEENVLKNVIFTDSDQKIIDWILDNENFGGVSNEFYSPFDLKFNTIEELCDEYGISSDCNFD